MLLPNTDLHLKPVKLDELRPTQMTVGYREVAKKHEHWQTLGAKARDSSVASHWFPAILGPKARYYIVDHHHLGLAWLECAVETVNVTVLKDLSWLDPTIFWRMMEHNQWVHPFDAQGNRRDYEALPERLTDLVDDPFRSLAGELRVAGGYAKDATPFSEFLWADYLRQKMTAKQIKRDFDAALKDALDHAHAQEARYLPGWCGTIEPSPVAPESKAASKSESKSDSKPKKIKSKKSE
ncbi:chromosome partitioning protein ParB [Pararobbsia silviterrae]|uniref:Chromosome partitioning protein ParB n=1 Tax=Pararobbsia silviterrae TaxID=1792498 RepID=A0A494Y160_9BURK|nr:chromosome partitioning protein ParB [Pararobbsia silviterrae]